MNIWAFFGVHNGGFVGEGGDGGDGKCDQRVCQSRTVGRSGFGVGEFGIGYDDLTRG